jgi:nucleotide sugar dehydrogenase
MNIAVVSLGKIGLPLAVQFATSGYSVVGIDTDEYTIEAVNRGLEPYPGEDLLQEKLTDVTTAGRFRATRSYAEAIPNADAIVIAAPLLVDDKTDQPDFSQIDVMTNLLAEHLTPSTLIAYETTLPVGTTRGRWKPLIESVSGLTEGTDFHLVHSAERLFIGRIFEDLRRYPKLIGAMSEAGALKAREFYEAILEFDDRPDLRRPNGVWDLGSPEASEMAKLAETTYRDVNIGLANQFGEYAAANGIDIYRVIEACNSQPFSHIHRPGISVGGLCIPNHPRLYLSTDSEADIVRTARKFNASMPERLVNRAADMLGSLKGMKAVVLGAAYRGGVKETTFSGVFPTVEALRDRGADVRVHDPLYSDDELYTLGLEPYALDSRVDIAIVHTDHEEYRALEPTDLPGVKLLVDGRAITRSALWSGIPRLIVGSSAP